MARHLFTSESVTEGHPDKICDQISDAVLDAILAKDPQAHVACETIATTGLVLVMGLGLFVVGVLFAYFVSLPFMLNFMATLEGADYIVQTTSIASYVSFCITIFLIFGAVFEMPLVVVVLSRMGIVSPTLMKNARGIMIVLIFFVAAVITPPDIVTQTMVALPMCILYMVSTALCKIFYKKHEEAEEADEDEEEDAEEA